jgi:chaperonin cofactor prefoldin
VDAGAFAGEGLVDTVKPGERRLVSYASDLGVVVASRPGDGTGRLMRVRIANGVMTREREERAQQVYTIRNNDASGRSVVIEHPVRNGWTLVNTEAPTETSATAYRFRVDAPAGVTTTLTVTTVNPASTQISLQGSADQLVLSTDSPATRAALEQAIRPVVEARRDVARIQADIDMRTEEGEAIVEDQSRVRENMKALQRSAEERKLLERYTRQLDGQESRLEELRSQIDRLNRELAAAQARLAERITSTTLDLPL